MTDDVVVKVEHVSKKFSKSLKRAMLYGTADISRNAFGMGTHPERLRKGEALRLIYGGRGARAAIGGGGADNRCLEGGDEAGRAGTRGDQYRLTTNFIPTPGFPKTTNWHRSTRPCPACEGGVVRLVGRNRRGDN